jgi:hypothetical protein
MSLVSHCQVSNCTRGSASLPTKPSALQNEKFLLNSCFLPKRCISRLSFSPWPMISKLSVEKESVLTPVATEVAPFISMSSLYGRSIERRCRELSAIAVTTLRIRKERGSTKEVAIEKQPPGKPTYLRKVTLSPRRLATRVASIVSFTPKWPNARN